LGTLSPFLDLEFHLSAFLQRPVSLALDGRVMHKYITPAGALDKSVALGVAKPLHNTSLCHYKISYFEKSLLVFLSELA
jgi:hypothetical protein